MAHNTPFGGGSRKISGYTGTYDGTLVPVEMLQATLHAQPIPITITGSNQVTFTLNASSTTPVYVWAGSDFARIDQSVAYTWVTGANNTILNSSGVQTASQSPATGVWYMYVTWAQTNPANQTGTGSTSTAYKLFPSQTAPGYAVPAISASQQGGFFGHPGASQVQPYIYVGFMVCTSASGAGTYKAMTKISDTYTFIADSTFQTGAPTSTVLTSVSALSTLLPTHGVTAGGIMITPNSSIADSIQMAVDASATGQIQALTPASATMTVPFSGFPVPSTGAPFVSYTGHSTTANIQFTSIVDLV